MDRMVLPGFFFFSAMLVALVLIYHLPRSTQSPKPKASPNLTRYPAVSGQFYPSSVTQLSANLDSFLRKSEPTSESGKPRILIVPHAGIEYSGHTAARGFVNLKGHTYRRIILLGPSHKSAISHVAVYPSGNWITPLGSVPVDSQAVLYLTLGNPQIVADITPHLPEHSLEVELIFLQKVLSDFSIVPVLVGDLPEPLFSDLFRRLSALMDEQTLLIVSSDLSHYQSHTSATKTDSETVSAILSKDLSRINTLSFSSACGVIPIKIGLSIANYLKLTSIRQLDVSDSFTATGQSPERVVGYASVGIWSEVLPENSWDTASQKEALNLARTVLESFVTKNTVPAIVPQNRALYLPHGVFITLRKHGELRGCVGNFEPNKPLYNSISDMTIAASSQDSRFTPVIPSELSSLTVEVSVLSPLKPVSSWQDIVLGRDGVVIEWDGKSGTFLPQVATETKWSKEEFLKHLCQDKAGLPSDCYLNHSAKISVFQAQVFEEDN